MSLELLRCWTCDFCGEPAAQAPEYMDAEPPHLVLTAALVPAGIAYDPAGTERRLDVCARCVPHVNGALSNAVRAAREIARARAGAVGASPLSGDEVLHIFDRPGPGPASPASPLSGAEVLQTAHATAHGGANAL